MLDLVQVRTFVAIVTTGGFQSAARDLRLSQPTVSQHLRKLEEELGAALIVRSHGGCRPTRKGESFLPFARNLLRAGADAIASIGKERLCVAAASNIGAYLLPQLLRTYLDASGDSAPVGYAIGTNPQALSSLRSGAADLALMEWWPDDETEFEVMTWRREPLVVILPPGHPWADRQIRLENLSGAWLLGGEPGTGTGRILTAITKDRPDLDLRTKADLGSTEAVKKAVAAGLGVSIVMQSCVARELATGELSSCEFMGPPLAKSLVLALPADTPNSARARLFASSITPISQASA